MKIKHTAIASLTLATAIYYKMHGMDVVAVIGTALLAFAIIYAWEAPVSPAPCSMETYILAVKWLPDLDIPEQKKIAELPIPKYHTTVIAFPDTNGNGWYTADLQSQDACQVSRHNNALQAVREACRIYSQYKKDNT